MAAITPQSVSRAGAAVTFAAASGGGDTAPVSDSNVLLVKNGDGSAHTFTLTTTQSVLGNAVADVTLSVAAGATAAIRLGPKSLYADANGNVAVAYSAVTSMTVAVLAV